MSLFVDFKRILHRISTVLITMQVEIAIRLDFVATDLEMKKM